MSTHNLSQSQPGNKLNYLQKYKETTVPVINPINNNSIVLPSTLPNEEEVIYQLANSSTSKSTVTTNTTPVSSSSSTTSSSLIPFHTNNTIQSSSPPRRRRRYDSDDDEQPTIPNPAGNSNSILSLPSSSSSSISGLPIISNTDVSTDLEVPRRRTRYDSDADDISNLSSHQPPTSTIMTQNTKQNISNSSLSTLIPNEVRSKIEASGINLKAVANTVYRDKEGRKINMVEEIKKQSEQQSINHTNKLQQRYEWNTGTVQKQSNEQLQNELLYMEQTPFARTKDDEKMNDILKLRNRNDDPMKHILISNTNINESKKLIYTGPDPPPNRYNIRPGYRWDGIDRGNGWEFKVLASRTAKKVQAQKHHLFSVSDM